MGYIHLNPLRARIVTDLKELEKHFYSGHSVLLGKCKREFQNTDYVLGLFGNTVARARSSYRQYVRKRFEIGRRPDLVGRGLLRSNGGWGVIKSMSKARIHLKGDERILGDSDFVEEVLAEQKEQFERRYWLAAQGYDIERVVERIAEILDTELEEVWKPGNQPQRVRARSLTCYWSVREIGMSGAEVGRLLGLSQSAVSRAVVRGERIARDMDASLIS